MSRRQLPWQTLTALVAIALGMTLLNCTKPMSMDDTFFFQYARQIARDPLHPGDFTLNWRPWPTSGLSMLPPPVVPYWLAISVNLFPDSPAVWKLSLLPFALLLTFGIYFVARQFAGDLALPIVAMSTFCPAILPGQNLMQDIPVQALTISGLAVQLLAIRKNSLAWAAVAGLLGGLACQTKYTGLLSPILMAGAGFLYGRWRCGIVAALLALGIFAGWELTIARGFGESPFVYASKYHFPHKVPKTSLVQSLLLSWAIICPAHLGWGLIRRRTAVGWILVVIGMATGGLVLGVIYKNVLWLLAIASLLALWNAISASACLLRRQHPQPSDKLLVFWFLLELIGFLVLSPFCAVRRLIGVLLASTLLMARNSALTRVPRPQKRLATWGLVAVNAAAGLVIFGIDWLESDSQRNAAFQSAAAIRQQDPDAKIWFVGHWGFQYYSERLGMRPVEADSLVMHKGEWLVLLSRAGPLEVSVDDPAAVSLFRTIDIADSVPFGSLPYYHSPVPFEYLSGPRQVVQIWNVLKDARVVTTWDVLLLTEWVKTNLGSVFAPQAIPALLIRLNDPQWQTRALAARALALLGPEGSPAETDLVIHLGDPAPNVRQSCCVALGTLTRCQPTTLEKLQSVAANDSERQVRNAAAEALKKL